MRNGRSTASASLIRDGDGKDVMSPQTRAVIESFRQVASRFRERMAKPAGLGSTVQGDMVDIGPSENGANPLPSDPKPDSDNLPENWAK